MLFMEVRTGVVAELVFYWDGDNILLQQDSQSVSHYHTPSRELMAHTLTLLKQ